MEETTMVLTNPNNDLRVQALGVEVQFLVQLVEGCEVLSDTDAMDATDNLTLIASLQKAFEAHRKEYLTPLNEHIRDVNASFRQYTDPLTHADQVLRSKALAYQTEVNRIAREQEEILRLRKEASAKEAALKGEPIESVISPEKVILPIIRTDTGVMGTSKTWKFEVEDFGQLPNEYKLPDMTKIRKVVIAGVSIPGVRAWQEETLRVTTPKGVK